MTVATAIRISLDLGCLASCQDFAAPLFMQLSEGNYDECAVQPLQERQRWRAAHRTARKRADRAERRGYTFAPIKREDRTDEIYAINLSADTRQGRPMTEGYRVRPSYTALERNCAVHGVHAYGVEDAEGILRAYTFIYRAGQLALVSQILGDSAYQEDEIMYLLVQETLRAEAEIDADGFLVYNRWDSGTDGLRFFKERLGFQPHAVEWLP